MATPSNRKRNLVGFGCVYALVLILWVVAPAAFNQEAEIHCSGAGVVAKFDDMNACSRAPDFKKEGCACFRVQNEWHQPYMVGVVPVLTTVLAYALLRGSLVIRLLLLNLAFTAAVVTQFIWSLVEDAAATLLTLPGLPIALLAFWLAMSLLFWVLKVIDQRVLRRNPKTATP